MRWYKRDPDAALAGTIGLTLEERGVYHTIIDLLYSRGGDLPDDDRFLALACQCHWRTLRAIKLRLIEKGKLHQVEGGKITANRVQECLKEASRYAQEQSKNAKKRWETTTEDMPSTTTTTARIRDGGGDERPAAEAPKPAEASQPQSPAPPLITEDAFAACERIAEAAGVGKPDEWPVGWCGAPQRVQAYLNAGYRPDVMVSTARAVMARKRDGPPSSISYFDKAFARAHMPEAPIAEVPHGQIPSRSAGNHGAGSALAAIREIRARMAGDADRVVAFELPAGRIRECGSVRDPARDDPRRISEGGGGVRHEPAHRTATEVQVAAITGRGGGGSG